MTIGISGVLHQICMYVYTISWICNTPDIQGNARGETVYMYILSFV